MKRGQVSWKGTNNCENRGFRSIRVMQRMKGLEEVSPRCRQEVELPKLVRFSMLSHGTDTQKNHCLLNPKSVGAQGNFQVHGIADGVLVRPNTDLHYLNGVKVKVT